MLTKHLREEGEALFAFVEQQGPALAEVVTQFKAWTGRDVIAHLHHSDLMALAATEEGPAFQKVLNDVMTAIGSGKSLIEHTRAEFESVSYDELVRRWQADFRRMCDVFEATDPDRRLPWFGPPMKVRMFTTARQMETWAHGLALYDAKGLERAEADRVQDIVFIGVRTFSFCFGNRGLPVPDLMPHLELTAPSGETWTYGEASNPNVIKGSAVEFAKVVTQTRNIADTSLEVRGPDAEQWMAIAQCFAGPPEEPPAPGTRFRAA